MYKKLTISLMALSLLATMGCNKQNSENEAPAPQPAVEAPKAPTPKAQEPVDPEKLARDKARSQQLLAEGRMLPPRTNIAFKAGKIEGNLSAEDASRSYLFRKSAVRRCYMNELAYHSEAKGVVTASLRHEAQQKATVIDYKSAIESDDFNKCMNEVISAWPLPQGVTLEVILDFSSTPAPTLQEVRESNRGLHDHNHEHGDMDHEEHEHGDMDHEEHEHAAVPTPTSEPIKQIMP